MIAPIGFVPWWAFPLGLGLALAIAWLIDLSLRHFEARHR